MFANQAKFVPVSTQRVASIDSTASNDVRVTVRGDPGEEAEFAFASVSSHAVTYVTCSFPNKPIKPGTFVELTLSSASGSCA